MKYDETAMGHYEKVEQAILYIKERFKEQPSLEEIAEEVSLSPFHFQRIFTEWAGLSPKRFLKYTTIEYAKSLLEKQHNLAYTATKAGLSGTGRLHDLFVTIEAMSPGEYKYGGQNLTIKYSFHYSPFGDCILGRTNKGICHIAFIDNHEKALKEMTNQFPNASYLEDNEIVETAGFFTDQGIINDNIKLHLKGTPFQIKVWEALLKIPSGELTSYGQVAAMISRPKAFRAVGTAIGQNPVAFLIPCHRVIQANGNFGQYRWNQARKTALIGWEGSQNELRKI